MSASQRSSLRPSSRVGARKVRHRPARARPPASLAPAPARPRPTSTRATSRARPSTCRPTSARGRAPQLLRDVVRAVRRRVPAPPQDVRGEQGQGLHRPRHRDGRARDGRQRAGVRAAQSAQFPGAASTRTRTSRRSTTRRSRRRSRCSSTRAARSSRSARATTPATRSSSRRTWRRYSTGLRERTRRSNTRSPGDARSRARNLGGAPVTAIAVLRLCRAVAFASPRLAYAVDLPEVDDSPVTLDVTETTHPRAALQARARARSPRSGLLRLAQSAEPRSRLEEVHVRHAHRLVGLRAAPRRPRRTADPQLEGERPKDGASRYRNCDLPREALPHLQDRRPRGHRGRRIRAVRARPRAVDAKGRRARHRHDALRWKVVANEGLFGLTLVGGLAQPRARRRAVQVARSSSPDPPINNDLRGVTAALRVATASSALRSHAGRGQPVVLSTHGVLLTRCAPYSYDANGIVNDNKLDAPFGTCEDPTAARSSPRCRRATERGRR